MLINFIPLLNVLAAYPTTSPVIPPPKEIIQSSLKKLFLNKTLCILSILKLLLFFSFALKLKV